MSIKKATQYSSLFLCLAGDSLDYHNGRPFTTKDRDNDARKNNNCAVQFHGAWWYGDGKYSNLNGEYFNDPGRTNPRGINWFYWKHGRYLTKQASMKIRPND